MLNFSLLGFIFLHIDVDLSFSSPFTGVIVEVLIVVIRSDRLIDEILAAGIAKDVVLIDSTKG